MIGRLCRLSKELVSQQEKDSDAVRVGMMGTAGISKFAVIYAAGKRRDVSVVAVASRDPERTKAFAQKHGIPNVLSGPQAYAELLSRHDVDAVYICLPTTLHLQWAMAALAAGKHVLLEKPATMNAAEAVTLQEAATRSGKVLMEAAHYTHHPAVRRSREIVQNEIGRVLSLEARFQMVSPQAWCTSSRRDCCHAPTGNASQRDFRRVKNLDRWWYCADVLLWMTQATGWKVEKASEDDFAISANLQLTAPVLRPDAANAEEKEQIISARIHMAADRAMPPFDWSLHAAGSTHTMRLRNMGFPFIYHAVDVEPREANSCCSGRREQHYGDGETTYEYQLAAFVAAARSGDSSATLVARTVATMRLVDDILKAAGAGPLPSVGERRTAEAAAGGEVASGK